MCGVVVLLRRGRPVAKGLLQSMMDRVIHRGPDDSGRVYLRRNGRGDGKLQRVDEEGAWCVGLGHRRLSILDLSESGRQPMATGDGQRWLTYNGEIFNYVELRRQLTELGFAFRTDTDTEVVLAAYQAWGMACFGRFRGMWGLALLDGPGDRLVLSRDRLGIKPLFVYEEGGLLAVISEPKQLLALEARALEPSDSAINDYLLTGYEDPRRSFFARVVPVEAGTCLTIPLGRHGARQTLPYWFPEEIEPHTEDPHTAAQQLRAVLTDSVRLHLRSDVPVGCALSGGLDSSSLAALAMAEHGSEHNAIQTFSAAFPRHPFDESKTVAATSLHLGTAQRWSYPTPSDVLRDFDHFVYSHDEPVGSLSQYAAYTVARIARANAVPVILNGQGGDEVLGGYWQCYYAHLRVLAQRVAVGNLLGHVVGSLLRDGNDELWRGAPAMLRRYLARRRPHRTLRLRRGPTPDSGGRLLRFFSLEDQQRRVYEIRYLILPRLLKWDDRNFMAFSVEGRYPFLDPEVIETCLGFYRQALYARGWVKYPLRLGMAGCLPASVVWGRKKIGFETPQDLWLRTRMWSALERLLRDLKAPLWHYVSWEEGNRLVQAVGARRASPESVQTLFRLFNLDRWLRMFVEQSVAIEKGSTLEEPSQVQTKIFAGTHTGAA